MPNADLIVEGLLQLDGFNISNIIEIVSENVDNTSAPLLAVLLHTMGLIANGQWITVETQIQASIPIAPIIRFVIHRQ